MQEGRQVGLVELVEDLAVVPGLGWVQDGLQPWECWQEKALGQQQSRKCDT